MTDKQIIIDGVDVSGCEFYNKVIGEDAYCNIDEEHLYTCISYDNCYYKQLKRKEQECEELNCTITNLENIRDEFSVKIDQLKTELEQEKALKETYLACYKAKHEDIEGKLFKLKADNDELKDLNTRLDNQRETYWKGYQKLKQTITEIKEICKKERGWVNCSNNMPTETAIFAEHILQKISECEGNDETN